MQLRYFLPPYHLAKLVGNQERKLFHSKDINNIATKTLDEIASQEEIGCSTTIGIEASPRPNLLPTASLYGVTKQLGGTLDPLPIGPNNRYIN